MNPQATAATPARRHSGTRTSALLGTFVVLAALLLAAGCADGDGTTSPDDLRTPTGAETTPTESKTATPDYSERGPFAVGIITLTLADERPVDVWYPAGDEATQGVARFSHNLNDPWPESIRSKVPVVDDIVVNAYPDVAGSSDGPFPVIVESHGFAGTRRDEALTYAHLASWGFVVVAPEHLERNRATVVGQAAEFVELDDSAVISAALQLVEQENAREGSPLEGVVDTARLAVDGLSAGGRAALEYAMSTPVDAVIGRAPAGPEVLDAINAPILIIASDRDVLVDLPGIEMTYEQLTGPRRLAVILNGGHNTFTDACAQIRGLGGLDTVALSEATGFPAELLEAGNNGCTDEYVDPNVVRPLIRHLQIAHVRWALGLDGDDSALAPEYIAERFPGLLADYRSDR